MAWYAGDEPVADDALVPLKYAEYISKAKSSVYAVIIADSEGGAVSADKTEANEGDTVTLTVIPAEGYVLDTYTLTVEPEDESVIVDIRIVSDGVYSFTMPGCNVTVTAAFRQAVAEPSYVITIPSGLNLNENSTMTITASGVQNLGDNEIQVLSIATASWRWVNTPSAIRSATSSLPSGQTVLTNLR